LKIGSICAWLLKSRSRSSPEVITALAWKRSAPTSTVTVGCARRLWYQSGLLGAPAGGSQEKHRRVGELSADLAAIGAKFLDYALVEFAHLGHGCTLLMGGDLSLASLGDALRSPKRWGRESIQNS
jgi:hypothetical protein